MKLCNAPPERILGARIQILLLKVTLVAFSFWHESTLAKAKRLVNWSDCCVGQAVVQFARRADNNREYAIKFFLDPDAFYAEAKLYATFVPSLRGSISQLHDADAAETMDALETYETMTGALSRGKGDTEELTLAPHEQGNELQSKCVLALPTI